MVILHFQSQGKDEIIKMLPVSLSRLVENNEWESGEGAGSSWEGNGSLPYMVKSSGLLALKKTTESAMQ